MVGVGFGDVVLVVCVVVGDDDGLPGGGDDHLHVGLGLHRPLHLHIVTGAASRLELQNEDHTSHPSKRSLTGSTPLLLLLWMEGKSCWISMLARLSSCSMPESLNPLELSSLKLLSCF